MDETDSFWKSTYGLPAAMRSERVADSFCQYVVERQHDLLTEDVRINEITRDNPSIETKGLRAWAGCPVEFAGQILGTLCVIDSEVREWTADDRKVLPALAAIASREIALRVALRDAEDAASTTERESARVRSLLDTLRASLSVRCYLPRPGLSAGLIRSLSDGVVVVTHHGRFSGAA